MYQINHLRIRKVNRMVNMHGRVPMKIVDERGSESLKIIELESP
jgi:hypothetical protein